MLRRLGLVAAMVAAGVVPAAAEERPVFDFRGEIPVPGGTARLEARCDAGGETVSCRVEGKGPTDRGFRAEGRILLTPKAPATSDPSQPPASPPRWF